MRVLGIDTSSALASVAVLEDGQLVTEISASVQARCGETLLPYVSQALAMSKVAVKELDLVAVGIGPGSFTGTRIGVATAKGLALGAELPLVGVVSLRALAGGLMGQPGIAATVIDAYKDEVYYAAYRRNVEGTLLELLSPHHATPEKAARDLRTFIPAEHAFGICGSGFRRYQRTFVEGLAQPYTVAPGGYDTVRAFIIAHEGALSYQQHGADDLSELEPCYVRSSDAKLPALNQARVT